MSKTPNNQKRKQNQDVVYGAALDNESPAL